MQYILSSDFTKLVKVAILYPMKVKISLLPLPKDMFNASDIAKRINNALDQSSRAVKVDYRTTTKTWKTDVKFKITTPKEFERLIATDSDIYNFVSGGTKPHIIEPKRAQFLRFTWGGKGSYKPATRPEYIGSKKAKVTGKVNYRKRVKHPGTKARNFPEVIGKKWEKEWPRQLQRALL